MTVVDTIGTPFVSQIAVTPNARRMGVATAIIDRLQDEYPRSAAAFTRRIQLASGSLNPPGSTGNGGALQLTRSANLGHARREYRVFARKMLEKGQTRTAFRDHVRGDN